METKKEAKEEREREREEIRGTRMKISDPKELFI